MQQFFPLLNLYVYKQSINYAPSSPKQNLLVQGKQLWDTRKRKAF